LNRREVPVGVDRDRSPFRDTAERFFFGNGGRRRIAL